MNTDNKYILTIAVPTYNGERTIKNLLDSLSGQISQCVELLIVDNHSNDNTYEIIQEYKKNNFNMKYVRNDKNIGPDANFLKCMQLSRGEFTWLVSDDDVLIENSVERILNFVNVHKDVSLIYATTVDFRGKYTGVENCQKHYPIAEKDICTENKNIFMNYAGYYWGFMSSFICKTDKFNKIENPERFYGTYWLQSYIHALCSSGLNSKLGIISTPSVGAGIYVNTANYDSATINGIYYKKMLDYMVKECGYDRTQLYKIYSKRICHLSRHDLLKEKASNEKKINKKILFECTYKILSAWFTVYPIMFIPPFICKTALQIYKKNRGMKIVVENNRPE